MKLREHKTTTELCYDILIHEKTISDMNKRMSELNSLNEALEYEHFLQNLYIENMTMFTSSLFDFENYEEKIFFETEFKNGNLSLKRKINIPLKGKK